MQDYQILLDARQRQQDLLREAADYRTVRSLRQTSQFSLPQRLLRAIGTVLITWGNALQRLQVSSPAAASAHSHRVKHPSL